MSTESINARVNPRRRAVNGSLSIQSVTSDINTTADGPSSLGLQRGTTFNSPSSLPCPDRDPILNLPSLPRRSPTCPKSLEAIAAGRKRMEEILGSIDLSSLSLSSAPEKKDDSTSKEAKETVEGRIPPLDKMAASGSTSGEHHQSRRGVMDGHSPFSRPSTAHHTQSSDSGLGSSISTIGPNDAKTVYAVEGAALTQTAITQTPTASRFEHSRYVISPAACKQIEQRILLPILREEKLKPFHPLVQSVPARFQRNDIRCLRDLEKLLLWLAPVSNDSLPGVRCFAYSLGSKSFTAPVQLFARYCEFTIQRIYMTVPYLNQRDQHLPADRPYTNGYFLDLVGQIQQYAAMVASQRQRNDSEASSKTEVQGDTMPALTLEGGLAQTGRPATLVSHLDGKSVSMADGAVYDPMTIPTMKRSLSNQINDEEVERSMARRKKNAPPMDINKKCSHCDKIFKRPCDLTKHEKTHIRPWKCTDPECKYSMVGWPTEKERDRHVNDRHSANPREYRCKFSPCSYTSKRESNCKQHMEKAHGWQYVRSKNNGKRMKPPSPAASVTSFQQSPPTPAMSTPISNLTTDIPTPASGHLTSPYSNTMSYDPSLYNPSPQYDGFIDISGGQPFSFAEPPLAPAFDFQLFPDADLDTIGLENLPPSQEFMDFQAALEASDPGDLIAPSADMDLDQFGQDPMGQYCFDSEFYSYNSNQGMPEL